MCLPPGRQPWQQSMFFRLFFFFLVCVKSLCKCSVLCGGRGKLFLSVLTLPEMQLLFGSCLRLLCWRPRTDLGTQPESIPCLRLYSRSSQSRERVVGRSNDADARSAPTRGSIARERTSPPPDAGADRLGGPKRYWLWESRSSSQRKARGP